MAHVLIDGYNLIGIAHDNLENVRNNFIRELCRYSDLKGHNITVVFDGWKSGQNVETKIQIGNVNIIYSKIAEKADLVIKKILSEGMKPWIVVSSDREIADFAKGRDFVAITADEFEGRLHLALHSAQTMEGKDDEDIELMPARRKGSPRKLSKKQKRKIRALQKL